MPGRRIVEDARRRIEHGVADGGEVGRPRPQQEPLQPGEQLAGTRGMLGESGERCAELSHRGGGREAVADHVADGQADAAVGERERVVPVAADLEDVAAGFVARRKCEPRERRPTAPGSSARCSPIAISRSSASRARSASSATRRA